MKLLEAMTNFRERIWFNPEFITAIIATAEGSCIICFGDQQHRLDADAPSVLEAIAGALEEQKKYYLCLTSDAHQKRKAKGLYCDCERDIK